MKLFYSILVFLSFSVSLFSGQLSFSEFLLKDGNIPKFDKDYLNHQLMLKDFNTSSSIDSFIKSRSDSYKTLYSTILDTPLDNIINDINFDDNLFDDFSSVNPSFIDYSLVNNSLRYSLLLMRTKHLSDKDYDLLLTDFEVLLKLSHIYYKSYNTNGSFYYLIISNYFVEFVTNNKIIDKLSSSQKERFFSILNSYPVSIDKYTQFLLNEKYSLTFLTYNSIVLHPEVSSNTIAFQKFLNDSFIKTDLKYSELFDILISSNFDNYKSNKKESSSLIINSENKVSFLNFFRLSVSLFLTDIYGVFNIGTYDKFSSDFMSSYHFSLLSLNYLELFQDFDKLNSDFINLKSKLSEK